MARKVGPTSPSCRPPCFPTSQAANHASPHFSQHLISDRDRAEWEAAALEYRAKHGDGPEEDEEDAENEWF